MRSTPEPAANRAWRLCGLLTLTASRPAAAGASRGQHTRRNSPIEYSNCSAPSATRQNDSPLDRVGLRTVDPQLDRMADRWNSQGMTDPPTGLRGCRGLCASLKGGEARPTAGVDNRRRHPVCVRAPFTRDREPGSPVCLEPVVAGVDRAGIGGQCLHGVAPPSDFLPAKASRTPPSSIFLASRNPKSWISFATTPVHPVWWLAPSPAPLSPWKYS